MASNVDVMDIFHCPLCIEKFDLTDRKPKILDCGHTNCLDCLTRFVKKSGRNCPQCRQPFADAPFFIKDNYLICPYLEEGPSGGSSGASTPSAVSQRFYCKRCNQDATDTCLLLNHDVGDKTSVILQRAQEAKLQAKRQFTREAAMLKDLTDTLENIKSAVTLKGGLTSRLHRELDEAKKEKEVLDKTSQLVETVPGTAFQDNDDIPRALDHFLQENSVRLFALEEKKRMLDMAKKCTITVSADESSVSWGGKLSLDENSPPEEQVLFYLIYLQLLNQQTQTLNQPSADSDCFSPSAPPMGDGKEAKSSKWAVKNSNEASLEELIANVKKCVLEGNVPDVKKSDDEDEDDDDDDDSDGSVSVVSDSVTIPDICKVSKRVFVGRIPPSAKPQDIKDLLSKFGKINYVRFLPNKSKKEKGAPAATQAPKYMCAIVYVPDEFTLENILRNRPIAYHVKGEVKGYRLNVQEDNTQKREEKAEAKKQRRQRKNDKKNPSGPAGAGSKQQEAKKASTNVDPDAGKRIYVNQVPFEVTEKQLQDLFSVYGHVTNVSKRRHGVGHKCLAFVSFKDEKSVERVMSARPVKYYGEGFPDGFDLQVREFRGGRAAPPPAAAHNAPGFNNFTDTMVAAAAATSAAAQMQMLSALQLQHNAAMQSMQSPGKPQAPPRQHSQQQNQNHRQQNNAAGHQNQRPMQQQQNQRPMQQQQQNQRPIQQQHQNQRPMQQQQQQHQNQRSMQQPQNQKQTQQQQPKHQNQNKKNSKNGDDNQCSIM